jgi:hypothetical protein
MMLRQAALCRRSATATLRTNIATRAFASVADGRGLGLPDKFGHFIGGEFV